MGIVGQIWYENGDSPKIVRVLATDFFDDFNRTDQPLETSPNWVMQAGAVGAAATVQNNALSFTGSGKTNPSIYSAPDTGNPNHFCEVVINTVTSLNGFNAVARLTPGGDYVGFRERSSTTYQIFQNVGGVLTQLGPGVGPIVSGDKMRLVVVGDQVMLYRNGALLIGPVTTTALTGTRVGMVIRGENVANLHDNWRSGAGTGA